MTQFPRIRLGTRRSPLAMAQAKEARRRLCEAHGWEIDAVELVPVIASGDKVQDRPLAEIGGKALWTRELDAWLAEERIDAAVHSLKDVETFRPESLTLAAILPRADKRDRLIGANSIKDLPKGAVIGTSAPRRAAQLLHHRPDCKVVTFRGNVATRLAKLDAGEADATFLAAAGLERLGQDDIGIPLDPANWLPAPAQGAIALECRTRDDATRRALAPLDHAPSRAEVMAERVLLSGLNGTCHSPIAVLCDHTGDMLEMRAAIFSHDGAERVDGEMQFSPGDDAAARALAEDLLRRASPATRALFGGTP
ncbi:hydroxymethylbilane synthase [Aurantiacibacter aquimixticola]|uniref:Porphobilinogen deaminase n=1 Tax=Aurantiacibacter aquimixticola TaxID=1958945 RepID=A0A419RQ47_9SPHN|nr:hydroxymethylbilane synthase [Aurantiacibacter aquimixticola]RJY07958.1 hydroxymethylbilane synthase [Aurantiacibacter aquimixticola]